MAERKVEIKTFLIHYMCDVCEKEKLVKIERTKFDGSYWYLHECPNCKATVTFREKEYPITVTEEV